MSLVLSDASDYVVTVAIFQDPRVDTPEKITDLRSALTNNETLACISVERDLHNDVLVIDEKTVTPIRQFADYLAGVVDWKNDDMLGEFALLITSRIVAVAYF
jgi:hypothetical protein